MDKQQRLPLWTELLELQHRYVHALDNNRLEDWPGFFVEDCRYEIIPKENIDAGLPAPIVYCRQRRHAARPRACCATPTSLKTMCTATPPGPGHHGGGGGVVQHPAQLHRRHHRPGG